METREYGNGVKFFFSEALDHTGQLASEIAPEDLGAILGPGTWAGLKKLEIFCERGVLLPVKAAKTLLEISGYDALVALSRNGNIKVRTLEQDRFIKDRIECADGGRFIFVYTNFEHSKFDGNDQYWIEGDPADPAGPAGR